MRIPQSALFASLVAQPQSVLRHIFQVPQKETDGLNPQETLSTPDQF